MTKDLHEVHVPNLELDGSFAVIHDEPFITIVYEDGEFKGTVVDATLDRLEEARRVAARYNLEVVHVRCDHHQNFDLRLREVHDHH